MEMTCLFSLLLSRLISAMWVRSTRFALKVSLE